MAAAPSVIWQRNEVDYVWPTSTSRASAIADQSYNVQKNVVTGVKYWQGVYYLTVPRWFGGVPSTLNAYNPANDPNKTYLLNSWPSWEKNKVGDCSAFQYVQSMEIDSLGRMWVIDVGSVNIFVSNGRVNTCPPKLVIIDIATQIVLRTHVFSPEVASYTESFLNDIVVDQKRGFAYITDTAGPNNAGGIVVYDYLQDTSRRYVGVSTMIQSDPKGPTYEINGFTYTVNNPSDTIALSSDTSVLFYGALSGNVMYQVPTQVLRDFTKTTAEITAAVQVGFIRGGGTAPGNPSSTQCDGMATSASGAYFYGSHPNTNEDLLVQTTFSAPAGTYSPTASSTTQLYSNFVTMQWVDTLAWKGAEDVLIFTTNRLQSFFFPNIHPLNWTDINFRVFEIATPGHNSYFAAQQQQPPIAMAFPSTGGTTPGAGVSSCAGTGDGSQLGWFIFSAFSGGFGIAVLFCMWFFTKMAKKPFLANCDAQNAKNQL